jgi:hypothetical protein
MSDASPFSSKLSKSKQNVDMQEGHLVSEGHISNEHDAYISNDHDAYSGKQNVDMQEGHVLSEGSLSNEHSTFSRKSSNKTQNLKHQKTDSIGSESYKANLSLFHKSMQYTTIQCSECFEAWPVKIKPKCAANYVCRRCKSDKKNPRKLSAQNSMIPSSVPDVLQGLTQIEEMLVARALPMMRVYVKPGGQRGYILDIV